MKQESIGPLLYAIYNHEHDPRIPFGEFRLHFVRYDTYFMTNEEYRATKFKCHDINLFEARKIAQLVNFQDPATITWNDEPFERDKVNESSTILVKTTQGYECYSVEEASMYGALGDIQRWCELRN